MIDRNTVPASHNTIEQNVLDVSAQFPVASHSNNKLARDGRKPNRIRNTRLSYETVKQAAFGPPRLDGNNSGRRVSEAVQ
ncbi:hypothetical protein G6321_00034340 [Bradyrhizobium barranii subsp. barranii]|uniref:Uncharacterized protein n=1 Tax=Bradyrhizobium barranii subsp. barranii TaxID=2823807 RepID=A0A7Z0QG58_9BRAD|nr:hypothetical protein [Bradyrhizobium barranii]UGX90878.1 hypothetical protein G6321_00034340 [Bradyrhizobium barranii subsp. barranii]